MKSFYLLRTNVGLTSNVKITIDSNYNLYLDSINSNSVLSDSNYKNYVVNINDYYDQVLPDFYQNLDSDIIFDVKYDNDNNIMFNTFDKQIDDLYITGANDNLNNTYSEKYEYFAPLYIDKYNIPKYFVIFRIDGPGVLNIDKNNFANEYLNKLKCVKVIDMTTKSNFGQWIHNNFIDNEDFVGKSFDINFNETTFSNWNGIHVKNGGYNEIPFYMHSKLEHENTYNDLEKFVYDGYKTNNVVYPNILNFNFLFDDQPATTTSLRKWSINRYAGFYMDEIEILFNVSTYNPSVIRNDVAILPGNILHNIYNKPFNDSTLLLKQIFVEYLGNFYEVRNVQILLNNVLTNVWKIISDLDLSGKENYLNKNIINIDDNNKITYLNGESFVIENYADADVYLIEINGVYHNLQKNNNDYYIYSDYGFGVNNNTINYYVNSPDANFNHVIDMLEDKLPKTFAIMRCKFTDIKDFDHTIVETKHSNYEYELEDKIVQTDESKMHLTDIKDINYPKNKVEYVINNIPVNIPTTSHYTANNEIFSVSGTSSNTDLNLLWRKNHVHTKWGYKNSLSSSDYPYYLNNNSTSEDFNRTVDVYDNTINSISRNLDYFYTINSSTTSYTYHSLHIENIVGNTMTTFSYNLNDYINSNYDYFTYFFDRKCYLNNSTIITNTSKFSIFNTGDDTLPNTTLFRGLNLNLHDVNSIILNNDVLTNINVSTNNNYDNYKFSILLSDNDITVKTDTVNVNQIIITESNNSLNWHVTDFWKHSKDYYLNDIVNYMDIMYIANTYSYTDDPTLNPSNLSAWVYYDNSIFWSPIHSYTHSSMTNSVVYNSGEYYYFNNEGYNNTFYIPGSTYSYNDIVLYQNKNWISSTNSNSFIPSSQKYWIDSNSKYHLYWNQTTTTDDLGYNLVEWSIINLWNSQTYYEYSNFVYYNNAVYYYVGVGMMNELPEVSSSWLKIYSIIPNNSTIYNNDNNNTLYMNNRYYLCVSNDNNSVLDNGINIYINNIYKNVLINIYNNDNTLLNLSNTDRVDLYKDIYSNLIAHNFINAINDTNNNYGFINKIKYVIINKDNVSVYDFNNVNSFKNLKTLISINMPDEIRTYIESTHVETYDLNVSQIKPKNVLNKSEISTKEQLNHYNNLSLGCKITKTTSKQPNVINYAGIQNKTFNILHRYSGDYEPIFYDIDLFLKGNTQSLGNYKFDTELTNFGKIREFIISKVNRTGSILKLKNSPNLKSIFPMIDEFGYTYKNVFIFKSNWDLNYYTECVNADNNIISSKTITHETTTTTPKNLI